MFYGSIFFYYVPSLIILLYQTVLMLSPVVLASCGYPNKLSLTGALKQQKYVTSQSWQPEAGSQGVVLLPSLGESRGEFFPFFQFPVAAGCHGL